MGQSCEIEPADYMGMDETTALSNIRDRKECRHENIRVKSWNHGRCSETGYDDSGTLYTCTDCDESWYEHELPLLLALQSAECLECGSTRKTVQSDRLHVNSQAVCCGEVA